MQVSSEEKTHYLEQVGLSLTRWTEKWFPDAFVFALLGIAVTFALGLAIGESPLKLAVEGGKSFWSLVPFTMQMAMVVIGGYVTASAPPVYRLIQRLAQVPKTGRGAVAFVALFSMLTSLLSWGFSLIFSGLLTRELARRVKGMDYRAAGAAAYLGLGAVWAFGLSSSAALLMATKNAIPPALLAISGTIPLSKTLFLWQSIVSAAALVLVSVLVAYYSAPSAEKARTAEACGVDCEPPQLADGKPSRPGEWLEYSPVLSIAAGLLLAAYLVHTFLTSPAGLMSALDLNTYNLLFLTAGLFLHGNPRRFTTAVVQSIPATGGVLIQFPFYGVIFGMITGTGIAAFLSGLFTAITTTATYPLLVAAYSALLGVFIPSGGSKWIIEAPYVLEAAKLHQVNLGWVVQIYNASEALPNLVNPFWMLPLLAILKVKARDLVGYSVLQMLIHIPLVFFLAWLFAQTLPYIPPAF